MNGREKVYRFRTLLLRHDRSHNCLYLLGLSFHYIRNRLSIECNWLPSPSPLRFPNELFLWPCRAHTIATFGFITGLVDSRRERTNWIRRLISNIRITRKWKKNRDNSSNSICWLMFTAFLIDLNEIQMQKGRGDFITIIRKAIRMESVHLSDRIAHIHEHGPTLW